jgi:uncharacterized membrane-anchored protein YhcB (DUF1043 family)
MFKKIFSTQVLVSLALIVGLVLGYSINDFLTAPKIAELEEKATQLEELQADYNQLQSDYDTLEENHTTLREDYDTLQATTVPSSQYNSLMEDHQELQDENDELTTEIDDLQEELEDSDKARAELQSQYTKLLEMYNEIRVLSWTFFIVDNIEVNLTTAKNEYTSIEDITGSTTMYYTSGEPFNGSFSLILWKVSPPQGVTSDRFEIYDAITLPSASLISRTLNSYLPAPPIKGLSKT